MSTPEVFPDERAILARFDAAPDAPESLRERVAAAICPGIYCESHDDCREDADAAIAVMRGDS